MRSFLHEHSAQVICFFNFSTEDADKNSELFIRCSSIADPYLIGVFKHIYELLNDCETNKLEMEALVLFSWTKLKQNPEEETVTAERFLEDFTNVLESVCLCPKFLKELESMFHKVKKRNF